MKYIYFISRACRLHRKMKMSFYEDKTAEILSQIKGVKCLIVSTALNVNQKKIISKKINNIEYFSLPNRSPEIFDIEFSDQVSNFIGDKVNNYLIFNQFYELSFNLFNFKEAKFFYSVHCPFSQNYSNKYNFFLNILHNIKNLPMLLTKHKREIISIKQLKQREKSSIIYSSLFVKKYYTESKLYYLYNLTLRKKSFLIPLCIKKDHPIKDFKLQDLRKKIINYKIKVAFIGRVCFSKGIDHIIKLVELMKKYKGVIFYIGGATELVLKKKIIKIKKEKKLDNLILNLDGIPNEQIRSLYSLFDFSLHLSNVEEGTSYSIMESMISKCVPITNYSSEMIKKKHGYVFKKINYNKIIHILNDKNFEKKIKILKLNTSNHIKNNFNEKVIIKKYKKILFV